MIPAAHQPPAALRRPAGRLVELFLFLTILVSSVVLIEPAPYEGMFALLAAACFAARVPVDRRLAPLIVLLALWNVGGLLSLIPFATDPDAVRFVAISLYLMVTAILFAAIVHDRIVERLSIIRIAYILAALFTASVGIGAYFRIIPNAESFMLFDRASGTFKDPNVFGPFMILPILFLIHWIIHQGIRLRYLLPLGWLAFALLLSFSRGAWAHFGVSALTMLGLLFLTAPTQRARMHVLSLGLISAGVLACLILAALSFEAVSTMFEERAKLTQYYDTGDRGRFTGHMESIPLLLERPNGFGPLQYINFLGVDAHQVYIHAFASYGWLGGLSYLALILSTLVLGFRAVMIRAPWQPFFIPVYATFVGATFEGLVVDTDHWRHFHLLLGLIWGLSAASLKLARAPAEAPAVPAPPRLRPAAAFRLVLPRVQGAG